MTTIRLRVATCERCGSTKAVEPPDGMGACPYCGPTVTAATRQAPSVPWRRWLLICAVLGIVAGLLR